MDSPASPRALLRATLLALALAGGRGLYVAHLTGGRFGPSALLTDAARLLLVLLAGALLDRLVAALLARTPLGRATGRARLPAEVARGLLRSAVLVVVLLPPLLVGVQLHPPQVACRRTPGDFGLAFEEVSFVSEGRRLSGWYLPGDAADGPVVLVVHGLAASKDNFLPAAALARGQGLSVLTFDLRGHGDSDPGPVTFGAGEWRDVAAAHRWLRRHHPGRPVHALAYSMGAAAVLRADAALDLFDRIVVDSTFSSLEVVARAEVLAPLGPLQGPAFAFCRVWAQLLAGTDLGDHAPVRDVARLRDKPLLIVHGTADVLFPPDHARRLHAAAPGSELWLVPGAGHVDALAFSEYAERVGRFLVRRSRSRP